jgi:hypothetical protein
VSIEARLRNGAREALRIAAEFDRPGIEVRAFSFARRAGFAVVAAAVVFAIVIAGIWTTRWIVNDDDQVADQPGQDEPFTPSVDAGDQPVLEIRLVDTSPEWPSYPEGPVYTVMLNGRLVVGQQQLPETMLRVPLVVDIGLDRVTEVIEAAQEIGLPAITTEIDEKAADPLQGSPNYPYWTFLYTDTTGTHELAVLDLDTAAQLLPDERYAKLFDLYVQLATWANEGTELGDLPVDRIEVMVMTSAESGSVTAPEPVPWPLEQPVAELPTYIAGIRCTVVTGPDVTELRDLLMSLPLDTPLADRDRWHATIARALIPGEPGCRLPTE